jgi:LacI family transcriptional regulator, repressor for deo operon, udp, cdd, tsx, nupC, and nupG
VSRSPLRRDPATIEDVARVAGVSLATVSRALRGLPNVATITRERVQKVADELGYRPDPNASRLATGRSRTIGIAVPFISQWYFAQVVAGVEAVLAEQGYDLLLISVGTDEAKVRFVREWPNLQRRIDALIIVDVDLDSDELTMFEQDQAVVATIGYDFGSFSAVTIDNRAAAQLAVAHLLGLGHRRIGLIGGDPDGPMSFVVPEERRIGYSAALAALDLPVDPALEAPGSFTLEGGAEAMRQLLALSDPPTAVFAMSDEMAFGAMRTAREMGLRVPEDMSIVGFDDHEFSSVMGLTTIRQPVSESGATAARQVLDALTTEGTTAHHRAATHLIVRSSTGEFASGARS